ncbi:MAG: SPFH domain-containing protein [Clostridiales bacterium]|nr:SPFH domain-containing protein [Clostridiales bacterium]
MNFIKKRWMQSRWIGNPPMKEGELLRKSTQQGLVMGMRLAVLEEQSAAVIVNGHLANVFLTGAYQLERDKMPLLQPDQKHNWLFPVELYFINMAVTTPHPWQPSTPLLTRDTERGLVQLLMSGSYAAQVDNPTMFMQVMVLQNGFYDWPSIHRYLQAHLNDAAVSLIISQSIPLASLAKIKEKSGRILREDVNWRLNGSGLCLRELSVETLEIHPTMQRLLAEQQDYLDFNRARMHSIVG